MANIEKRTNSKGTSYRVKVRLKGFPLQTATFERITDAKKWAQDTESAIRDGRYFKTSQAKKHTAGELIDRYIINILPHKPKSVPAQKKQLEWWKQKIGAYALADVTPSLITEWRDKLYATPKADGKQRSTSNVNRYLAALSHALTIGVNEWEWLNDSPMRKVSKLKEPRGRVRFLSDAERDRLLAECKASRNQYLYTIVMVAISSGMRLGEIMWLKWEDIDFTQNKITLHDTKNGERRVVPIASHIKKLLLELFENKGRPEKGLLFPATGKLSNRNPKPRTPKPIEISKAWNHAVTKAELEDFHFHDLRHTAASYLAMNGASLAEIAEVLGHKTLQMVKRYAHLSEAHTASVVERMNQKIFG